MEESVGERWLEGSERHLNYANGMCRHARRVTRKARVKKIKKSCQSCWENVYGDYNEKALYLVLKSLNRYKVELHTDISLEKFNDFLFSHSTGWLSVNT